MKMMTIFSNCLPNVNSCYYIPLQVLDIDICFLAQMNCPRQQGLLQPLTQHQ